MSFCSLWSKTAPHLVPTSIPNFIVSSLDDPKPLPDYVISNAQIVSS